MKDYQSTVEHYQTRMAILRAAMSETERLYLNKNIDEADYNCRVFLLKIIKDQLLLDISGEMNGEL